MKKLLVILAISALAITSTFAVVATSNNGNGNTSTTVTSSSRDIKINGSVATQEYSFNLDYESLDGVRGSLSSGDTIADSFDLSKKSETGMFYVTKTDGNRNKHLFITVDITPESFKGEVNGENYDTEVTPVVYIRDNKSNNGKYDQTNSLKVNVPAGVNKSSDVAQFYFIITGNENVPAGEFVSNVNVSYTYD